MYTIKDLYDLDHTLAKEYLEMKRSFYVYHQRPL